MKHTHSDSTEELTEISVIKLFKLVQSSIEKINVPPLTIDDLEINVDAYAELGGDYDPDEVGAFARIGIEFPKKYSDLAFTMMFDANGVALSVGSLDFIYSHYEHLGGDERTIAKKLVNILSGLANGQLAVLNTYTQDDDKVQAWEMLYRKPGKSLYDAIATYATFDSERKLKDRELATKKFANNADIKDVTVDIEIYKQFTYETDWINRYNRKQIASLHIPLTRADWEGSVENYYDEKADTFINKVDQWANKDDRSLWEQILDVVKWRHLELLWWSLALLAYQPIREWSFASFHPSIIVFGTFVIIATIYRRNKKFYRYYTRIKLLAYISILLAVILHVTNFDGSIWWYALAIIGTLTLLENIFFGTREKIVARRQVK